MQVSNLHLQFSIVRFYWSSSFYPDGFQRNVIDFYFIFSDCRLRKALYLQFSYFIWPLCGHCGENAKKIAEYIQNQLKEDQIGDQMTIKEYIDPFTGSKH